MRESWKRPRGPELGSRGRPSRVRCPGVRGSGLGSSAPGSWASRWGRVLWGPPVLGLLPLVILSRLERPLAAHLVLPTLMGRPLAASLVWTCLAGSGVLDTAVGSRAPGSCTFRRGRALCGPPVWGSTVVSLVPNVPLPLLSRQERPLAAHLVLPTPTRRPLAASLVWTFLAGSGILDTALGSSAPGFCASRWGRVLWSPPVWGPIAVPLAPNVPLVLPSRQERPLAAHLVLPAPTLRPPAASPVWTYLAGTGVLVTVMGSRALGSWAPGGCRELRGPGTLRTCILRGTVARVIQTYSQRQPFTAHLVLRQTRPGMLAKTLVTASALRCTVARASLVHQPLPELPLPALLVRPPLRSTPVPPATPRRGPIPRPRTTMTTTMTCSPPLPHVAAPRRLSCGIG